MKVLLKGWYGQENLGDDLLFFEVMKILYPQNDVKVIGNESGLRYYRKYFPNMTFARKYSFKTGYLDIVKTDALVLGGGGLYPKIRYNLRNYFDLIFAILLGKALYIISIGINPQKRGLERMLWNYISKKASFISVRDELSLKLFNSGVVKMCYDLFFINSEPIVKIPKLEKVGRKIAIIGLAHPFDDNQVKKDPVVQERYFKLVKEISLAIRHLDELEYQIVFIPFLLKNDSVIIEDVKQQSHLSNTITLEFNKDYQIDEINSVYRYADFCLGMRFHSKVLAINNSVNLAGICYDFKSEALLSQVGLSDVGLRYGISKENFFGEEIDLVEGELVSLINNTISNKDLNVKKMNEALEVIKAKSEVNRQVLESIK